MDIELRLLTITDGYDTYEMLQEIPEYENGYANRCHGRSFEDYKKWLVKSENNSRGIDLESWKVPQEVYWLYIDGKPVGQGKVRYQLSDLLREQGGHIGYVIRPSERNKGYGTILLKLLLEKTKNRGIERVLITVLNHNTPSIKVALNNGGIIEKENDQRKYIWFNCRFANK